MVPRSISKKVVARYSIIFLLICIMVINVAFVLATVNELLDFGSFIAAGINAGAGKDPYDNDSPLVFHVAYEDLGIGGALPNLNPPISVLFFLPLGYVDPFLAATAWRILSAGLYGLAIGLLWKEIATTQNPLLLLWGFSLAGFWHTIQLGQIYAALFLAFTLALVFENRGKFLTAGILAGFVVAIKPNFLVWILLLAANRKWKIVAPALTSFIVFSAIPAVVFGPEIYHQWLNASSLDGGILGLPGNNSLPGLTTRLGSPETGLSLGILLVLVYGGLVSKKGNALTDNSVHELGIILSLLCSPVSWTGYTIFLAPAYFTRKKWSLTTTVSAVILVVPFIFPLLLFDNSRLNFVFWGWFYGWAILLQLFHATRESRIFRKSRTVRVVE